MGARPAQQQMAFAGVEAETQVGETQERSSRQVSSARKIPADYHLETLTERFLHHLETVRRCSGNTVEAYRSDLRKLEQGLKEADHDLDVRGISCPDIERVISGLDHLAAASVERFIYALRSFFQHLKRLEIVPTNPAADIQLPQKAKRLPRCFTARQVEKLTDACETLREKVIVGLLRYCGLRRGELLDLDISDVSANCQTLRVIGKGNRERAIPLHPQFQGILREYVDGLDADKTDALIRNTQGTRLSPTSLYRLFHGLMQRAGLSDTDLTPHSLRHYFGSQLAKAGIDVVTIAELMGHSNIQTTSIYLHSDTPTKHNAIRALSR